MTVPARSTPPTLMAPLALAITPPEEPVMPDCASPDDATALANFLREAPRYEAAFRDLTAACRRRLAVVRGQSRRVFGATVSEVVR